MHTFDLRDRGWLNARMLTGALEPMGIREVLRRAHLISDIEAPTPPGYAGLRHILTALAYRVTGLDRQHDVREWRHRRDLWLAHATFASTPPELAETTTAAPGDPVEAYFERLPAERFDLFGPRPFLQDPRLTDESTTCGINKLVLGRPNGVNGATWWTPHHKDRQGELTPQEAAWWLIVQWFYGAAGQITPRTVNGTKSSSSKAGMLRNTITYYARGRNLFESLLQSLVPPAAAIPDPATGPGPDLCPWEWEELPDPDTPPRPPGGMCALLTGVHAHSMLLVGDDQGRVVDVYRTWAYRKPWPERKNENPFVSYERSKGSQRTADPARALWRELDCLLPITAAGETGRTVAGGRFRPPRFLEERVNLPAGTSSGVIAVGFHQDPMTTDHAWWTSTAPQELTDLLDASDSITVALAAQRILTLLDTESRLLRTRLRAAWRNGVRSGTKEKTNQVWPNRALPLFWEAAESLFYARVDAESNADDQHKQQEERASAHAARELTIDVYDTITRTAFSERAHQPNRQDFLLRRAVIQQRPPALPRASGDQQ